MDIRICSLPYFLISPYPYILDSLPHHGIFINLCVCKEILHCGFSFTYSTIKGITLLYTLYSGCRKSLQFLPTSAACSSAHLKSLLLYMITFSSPAFFKTSFNGALNFLGETQIQ